jgi:hypothetical protein
MEITQRCKACGAILDTNGYCSKPCRYGELEKKIAELRKKVDTHKSYKE